MSAIQEAKAVIRSHEELCFALDLEGVLGNMADDIVALAPDAPLVIGRDGVRALYEGIFSLGRPEFVHEYRGVEEVGDIVVAHGVSRGSLTPSEGEPIPMSNNFILTLRREEDGSLRFWRAAFAGSGE